VTEFSFEHAQVGNLPGNVTYDPTGVFTTISNSAVPLGIPLRESKYFSGMDPEAGSEVQGLYTYTDVYSKAGFAAWYAVRSYDSGHNDWNSTGKTISPLESAPGPAGSTTLGGRKGIVPVVPGAATFDRMEVRIKVVPNPFKADDNLHTYNRKQALRFINLPGRCQIDLYDLSGQRFWTFFNDNPLTAEVTYKHLTEGSRGTGFGEVLFSGIYFWKVTSLMPESMGKVQKGTFVVIK